MLLLLIMIAPAMVVECCCVGTFCWGIPSTEMYYASEIIGVRHQEMMILCAYGQPSVSNVTLIDSLTRF